MRPNVVLTASNSSTNRFHTVISLASMFSIVSELLLILAVLLHISSPVSAALLSPEEFLPVLQDGNALESTPEESLPLPTEEIDPPPEVFIPNDSPNAVITPSSSQAANISRSRLMYTMASYVPVVVNIPPSRTINLSVTVAGSLILRAVLADVIEMEVEKIAANSPKSLRDFFNEEKQALQQRAGDRYFFFFQAAANFGYSNSEKTRRILHSPEFKLFLNQSAQLISSQNELTFMANYSVV